MIKRILTSQWLQFTLMLGLVFFLAFTSFVQFRYKDQIRHFSFDTLNRMDPREPSDEIIIVDIDEETLRRHGQWPFPRTILADLVDKLKSYGVKSIAFDMVFAEEDRTSPHLIMTDENAKNHDQIFAASIAEAGNVISGFVTAKDHETRREPHTAQPVMIRRKDKSQLQETMFPIKGAATNIPVISNAAAGNGIFLASPSNDGIIREIPILVHFQNQFYPTLAIESLRVASNPKERLKILDPSKNHFSDQQLLSNASIQKDYLLKVGEGGVSLPLSQNGKFRIKFRELDRDADYLSVYKILDPAFRDEVQAKLNGKIAFIGTSPEGMKDIRSTPLNVFVPGVEVHFNVAEQILQQDFVYYDAWLFENIERAAIIVIGFAFVVASFFVGILVLTFLMSGIIGLTVMGAYIAYVDHGVLFDPLYPSLCLFVIFMVTVILNYLRAESQAKEIRSAFGLYISPEFMKELTHDPDKLKLGGEQKELTVMFTDIRNFTGISESMTPEELIITMNDFLTPMSDVVMGKRGTIDKYIGDAMMAFWNAPLDDPNHARHAIEAALQMREVLDPVNKQLADKAKKQGREPLLLAAGIGINTGICSVGNMGSKQRFAYSALGDAVNLSSRLEGQTKSYGLDLLIGDDTAKHVRDFAIIDIDTIQVKGKTEAVKIYTVLGDKALGKRTSFRKFRVEHKQFLRAYRFQKWRKAKSILKKLLENKNAGTLQAYYKIMYDRIRQYEMNPPEGEWRGVHIADSK